MYPEAASLENLQDIVELPPVSWWPLASGWWFLLGALVVLGLLVGWRQWLRWQANAYRRAAIRELEAASNTAEVADILKRAALCVYPRTHIASLTGSSWVDWLRETGGGLSVTDDIQTAFAVEVFSKSNEDATTPGVIQFARDWITRHQPPASGRRHTHAC